MLKTPGRWEHLLDHTFEPYRDAWYVRLCVDEQGRHYFDTAYERAGSTACAVLGPCQSERDADEWLENCAFEFTLALMENNPIRFVDATPVAQSELAEFLAGLSPDALREVLRFAVTRTAQGETD